MAPGDPLPSDPVPQMEPAPELVDWWVWGVRKASRTAAEILMASRGLIVLFVLLKLVLWALSGDAGEIAQAGAGIAGLVAIWASAVVLGRFGSERVSPDPERWLAQRDQ